MKKVICILGMLFGVCCVITGLLFATQRLNFSSKIDVQEISKTEPNEVKSYRFGADFYTEVSKSLSEINESLRAVNDTQTSAVESVIKNQIQSTYVVTVHIQYMLAAFDITFGIFVILLFLIKFADAKNL